MRKLFFAILLATYFLQAGSLFMEVEPRDSRIFIMNIKPKFHQGIDLKAGNYDILVKRRGYKTYRKWIYVGYSNKYLDVNLQNKRSSRVFQKRKTKKEAILKLDTGGHSANIQDILVTKSGDIISASDDKTIRVWNSKTGEEKRKILGKIGEGSEGKVFAIALSPDEKYLAVGGILHNSIHKETGAIKIYSYKTGKVLQILKSHENVVFDLAFSEDGKYLISGSADNTAKVWRVRNWSLERTFKNHSAQVYAVKFIGDRKIVTAGYDNRIILSNIGGRKIGEYKHSEKLQYLAVSSKYIATCGFGKEILIFDRDLNLVKKIKSETVPTGLNFSPNGKYLIAGTGAYPLNVNIYQTSNFQKTLSFQKHTNLTKAVNFLDNQTAISGGGSNKEIYIWNIFSGKVQTKIVGKGQTVWSVGQKGDLIGWGNVGRNVHNPYSWQVSNFINISNFQIRKIPVSSTGMTKERTQNIDFKKIPTTYKNYSLRHSQGGNYGHSDAVLEIQKNGKTISKIVRGSTDGLGHNSYGFWKNRVVSGGSNGHLKIYNLQGEEIANLVGHTGTSLEHFRSRR